MSQAGISERDTAAKEAIKLLEKYVKEVEAYASQALAAASAAQEALNGAKKCAENAAKQYGKSDNASAGVQVPNKDNKNEIYEYIENQATAASEHSNEASVAVNNISDYIEKVNSILKTVDNRSFNTNNVMSIKIQAIKEIRESLDIMSNYQKQTETNAKKTQKYAERANKSLIENDPVVSTYRDLVTESNNLKNFLEEIKNNAEKINTIKKPIDTYRDDKSFLKDCDINDIIGRIKVIIGNIIAKYISSESIDGKYKEIEKIIANNISNKLLIKQYKIDYNANIKLAKTYLNETIEILYQIINNTLDFVINNYKNMITRLGDENETHNEDNITSYNTIIENNKGDLDSIFTTDNLNTTVLKDVQNKTSDKYNEYENLKEELMAAVADNAGADDGGVQYVASDVASDVAAVPSSAVSFHADDLDNPVSPGAGLDAALDVAADSAALDSDVGDDDDASSADGAAAHSVSVIAGKRDKLQDNIATYIHEAYNEKKFDLPEQINISAINVVDDNSISLPLDYCVEYPTIKNDDFSKNGKTFTFYRMLINQVGFQKYFINDVIKTSVIHITLTNISKTDDTHLLSIRLKDMKNIKADSFLQKVKNYLSISNENKINLNNMRKEISIFVGMKDGKVNFSNINKFRSGNNKSFPDPGLKFKNIKYILFLGKLQTKEGNNYTTTYNAVYFNISKVIYIYSENIPNTDCFEKVKAETDIFSKKILYCLYNIDYITFTGNYLNYILQELKLKGGNKDEPRPPPPNRFFTPGSGGNNQIDVINNLEVNNNNKDFKEVHEEDVIISDKIIKKKGNKIQKKLTKTKKVPEKAYDIVKEKAPKKAPKKLLIDFS